jgi:acetyltransferase-like isoleucine patch superfamily enzyme
MRLKGGRLVLDAPYGARLKGPPTLHVSAAGEGEGVLRLRIGRGVSFGKGVSLRVWARGTNELELGDGAQVHDGVRLWVLGGKVLVGSDSILRDQALLKSKGTLEIGERTRIGYSTLMHCHQEIRLEDHVVIADQTVVIDSDHIHDGSDEWVMAQPVVTAPLRVGRNTLVSANSLITRGAEIGANSVVAGGAVVRAGAYPASSLLVGAPARRLRSLRDDQSS